MYRILPILLGVFVAAFLLSVFNASVKYGLTPGEAMKVVSCSYGRVGQSLMQGRFNASSELLMTQCLSDTV